MGNLSGSSPFRVRVGGRRPRVFFLKNHAARLLFRSVPRRGAGLSTRHQAGPAAGKCRAAPDFILWHRADVDSPASFTKDNFHYYEN